MTQDYDYSDEAMIAATNEKAQPKELPPPSTRALELAAQAWCDEESEGIEMDTHLANSFGRILDRVAPFSTPAEFEGLSLMNVAALFIDPKGPYASDPRFDAWPLERDARKYQGPFPVIAHPPCQLWGPMANVNFARYGGEHNRPGNDGGCFASALESVNKFGGVLEHPAFSRAWAAHNLKRPTFGIWIKSDEGWVTEVWQSAYGHKARKRTWLYCVSYHLPNLKWEKTQGTHQIGGHDQRGKEKNKPTISGRAASATPREFLEVLYQIAVGAP